MEDVHAYITKLYYFPEARFVFGVQIVGLNTNTEFLANLCANKKLLDGKVNTAFIEENGDELLRRLDPSSQTIAEVCLSCS